MNNIILTQQNDPFLLQCLLAQRSEYTKAKIASRNKLIIITLFTIFSMYSLTDDSDILSAIASLFAVVLIIFNKNSEKHISSLQKHAASIQHYFDATLFASAIGGTKDEWGELLNKSDLANSISNITATDTTDVRNWYRVSTSLPVTSQIFYCQRQNVRWEQELRKSYIYLQIGIFLFVTLTMLATLLFINPSVVKVISMSSCLVSIGEHTYSICRQIIGNILLSQKIESLCDHIENKITEDHYQPTKNDLIRLQHKIKENRENCYLIPDWFYRIQKEEYQKREETISRIIDCFHRESGHEKKTDY